MHPLLPFYAAFSLLGLLGLDMRDKFQRTALWIAAWGAMLVILFGTVFREIRGDTWRYYMAFLRLRDNSLAEVLAQADDNWLFAALNWGLGQLGSSPLWLIAPVAVFCVYMLYYSLRQILGPMHATIGILLYSAFPFWVFYVASGLKQAIAMAMLMHAYICFHRGLRRGWIWLLIAPLFHTGAILVLPFLFLHLVTWRPSFGYRRALYLSLGLFVLTTGLSITDLNAVLMAPGQDYALALSGRYEGYFMTAEQFEHLYGFQYRGGFRLDFMLFSLAPLLTALWLRRKGRGLRLDVSGWWLNLYILLICIYQLFAFAPFADRFAAFGWNLLPLILMVMLSDAQSKKALQYVVLTFCLGSIFMLQFYTGGSIPI